MNLRMNCGPQGLRLELAPTGDERKTLAELAPTAVWHLLLLYAKITKRVIEGGGSSATAG